MISPGGARREGVVGGADPHDIRIGRVEAERNTGRRCDDRGSDMGDGRGVRATYRGRRVGQLAHRQHRGGGESKCGDSVPLGRTAHLELPVVWI